MVTKTNPYSRTATLTRRTKETQIDIALNIDGSGKSKIDCEIGFLKHMLNTLTIFSLFDLEISIKGDLEVDYHHTIEDSGIVLGKALATALGEKKSIHRNGFCLFPMDESLILASLDISGRSYLNLQLSLDNRRIANFNADLFEDFFQAFTNNAKITLHLIKLYGRSTHHILEATFKSLGRALQQACQIDKHLSNSIPSSKGLI